MLYMTRVKADFSEFSERKLGHLQERAARTQARILEQFNEQAIMRDLGEFLKERLRVDSDLVDCSSSIIENTLRVRGFTRSS